MTSEPLKILLIEDDADTLANLTDILDLDGHKVWGVSTLQEAKKVADENPFDVAISDRKLPDGLIEDVLQELKRSVGGAEIIVVTGFADIQSTITAFRLGVSDYVIKPVIPDDLRQTVARIAQRRSLESTLAEEQSFAENVLETAEAIVLVLDLNCRVIRFNPYFEQLTGWNQEFLVGRDWFENCIPEFERERIREIFIRTAHDLHTRGVVNAVLGHDGKEHQIRWSNTVLRDGHGDVTSVLAVGVDVSDLEEAQTRALQAERLATIGQTMTALAHESRNALQRIQAASEMLELEIDGSQSATRDLASINRACKDLQRLLEEVRAYASPIQIQTTHASIKEIWQRVWSDLIQVRAGRSIELIEGDQCEEISASVDSVRFEQVFRNLFENSLAACEDPVRLQIDCSSSGDNIEIRFSDNGPGMTKTQMEKAFEPFFTTKSTGTGLGLAIAQRIIEAHHGTIQITSERPGAHLVIRLPVESNSRPELLS